jgi:hypothetical protein
MTESVTHRTLKVQAASQLDFSRFRKVSDVTRGNIPLASHGAALLNTAPAYPPGSGGTGRLSTEVKRTEVSHEGDKCPCRRDKAKHRPPGRATTGGAGV